MVTLIFRQYVCIGCGDEKIVVLVDEHGSGGWEYPYFGHKELIHDRCTVINLRSGAYVNTYVPHDQLKAMGGWFGVWVKELVTREWSMMHGKEA